MAKTKKIGFLFTAVDKTKAAFDGINKSLSKIGSVTKTVGKGILAVTAATTAAAAAFSALVLKTTDYVDNLGKVSEVTGVSTDLLQKFRFAAEQAGVTGDNAALALRRFSRRLGEAARGSGELKPALDKLGISVFNLDGTTKSAEQVLLEFADGISKTQNQSERLALAFKAFDSEGAELVATLGKGSAGLREFFETAERLGLVLDKDAIKNTMDFKDRLNELTSAITAFGSRVITNLMPAFTGMTISLTGMFEKFIESKGGVETFSEFLSNQFVEAIKIAIKFFEGFGNTLAETIHSLKFTLKEAEIAFFQFFYNLSNSAAGSLLGLSGMAEGFGQSMMKAALDLEGMRGIFEKPFDFTEAIDSLDRFMNPITEITVTAKKKIIDLKDTWGAVAGAITSAAKTVTTQMEGAFTEFFNITSQKFMDFKSLVSSILKSIITQMTKMFVQTQIFGPKGFLAGTAFGNLLGIPGKAAGGTVTAGRPYLVGEKGAELFVPNQTGTIVPNDKMGGAGTSVNVAFNITAWDSKDATQAIAEQAPNIVSIVENSFRRRGQILGAT